MTAILDRIQSVRNKLDSFENIDQAQDYISTLSSDDYFSFKIFLKSWKNLKSFIAKRNDVDDEFRFAPLGSFHANNDITA